MWVMSTKSVMIHFQYRELLLPVRKKKKKWKRKKEPKRGQMRKHLKEPWRQPKSKKIEIRERGSNTTILLFHTCALLSTYTWVLESFHIFSCITMWGSFHYRTWLVYFKDEPPQVSSRSSWASKLDAPPTSFFGDVSYTYSSMCIRCMAIITPVLWLPSPLLSLSFWPSQPPLLFSLP